MKRTIAALLVSCALTVAACGDDVAGPVSSTTIAPTTTVAPTTTPVPTTTTLAPEMTDGCVADATETRTLVDETRITPATAELDEVPTRTLDVWIDRPTTPGPWPLIVFAHGLTGHPRSHELHRRYLAEECFVVVAPAFPLTNNDVPNAWFNAGDVPGQIADVSFLIDEVLADADLSAVVDPDRIGVIGHSLGGLTTAGAAVAPDADSRVSAAVVMSAGFVEARDDVAVMVLHGDADNVVSIDSGIGGYGVLSARATFVTLLGGDHLAGITDDESDYGPVVRGVTGAFFALELDNVTGTIDEMFDLPLDLVSIEARTEAGPLDDWRDYFAF